MPSSIASVQDLLLGQEDYSLLRAGECINVTKFTDENFIANAYKYCRTCLGGAWANCPIDKFSVDYLNGGMTNYLYLCSLDEKIITEDGEPRKVLIRIYGSIIEQKQRFYEGVIFTLLSERGYGPKTLGVFYSGRIEEFIPSRNLSRFELASPEVSQLISQRTAEYHCMKLPLNKTPTFLWEGIEKYIDMCDEIVFGDAEEQSLYESIKKNLHFRSEYIWLKQMLCDLHSPVVFCHNDLHEGNMLYIGERNGAKANITLIDYDYSSYNYRGYDIGNHFCEFIYEYDLVDDSADGFVAHKDNYPTHEQQVTFATEYIATLHRFHEKSLKADYDRQRYIRVIEMCSVDRLLFEANRFALASHLLWGLWSIVQQRVSQIEFGYLKYAEARLEEYARKKQELGY